MKKQLLIIGFSILSGIAFSQDVAEHNEKSKDVLAKVSENYQNYKSLKFTFNLTINSQDINETQTGYALIRNDQFYYETEERNVICNGETVWTLIPDDDECYIDNLSDLDNAINPSEIFTIWKHGFNYKYLKKEQNSHYIKMFPQNPDKSKYHTIIMKVNDESKSIEQATVKTKDGVTIKLTVKELTPNPEINSNKFTWNENDFPSIDVIDNR